MKRPILLLASVLLLLLPVWGVWSFAGQPPTVEEILRQTEALLADSRYEEALALLEGFSASYPGTRQDAAARMEAAAIHGKAFHDLERCRQIYGSIIQDFPRTVEAVLAASNQADLHLVQGRPLERRLPLVGQEIHRAVPRQGLHQQPGLPAAPPSEEHAQAPLAPSKQPLQAPRLLTSVQEGKHEIMLLQHYVSEAYSIQVRRNLPLEAARRALASGDTG